MDKTENAFKEITLFQLYSNTKNAIVYLLSKWFIIIVISVIATLAGIGYAFMQKPIYTATTRFAMEDSEGGGLGAYSGIAAQFGLDLGGGEGGLFSGENLMELMKSDALINKALFTYVPYNTQQELLINFYLKKNGNSNNAKQLLFDSSYIIGSNRIKDSVVKAVCANIKTALAVDKVDKKLSIMAVTFKDNNELFAKEIVEVVTSTVIDYYIDYRNKKFKQNVNILQRQTDSVRGLITGDMTNIAVSNDLNVNPLRQIVRVGTQRKQMDVQTNTIMYGELLKQLEFAKIILRKETPLIQIIDKPLLPLEKKKKGKLITGLTFGFAAGILMIFFFLIRRAIRQQSGLEKEKQLIPV